MAESTKAVTVTATQPSGVRKARSSRYLNGTDFYIAEFILWLIVAGVTIGTLVSLWYDFFGLMNASGSVGHDMAVGTVTGLGSLIVLLPLSYILRCRVQGEELRTPARRTQKSRSVFLTLWILIAAAAFISMCTMVIGDIFSSFYGFGGDASNVYVGSIVPSLLGALTLGAGSVLVLKQARGRLMQTSSLILGIVVIVLFVGGFIVAAAHKDDKEIPRSCLYSSSRYSDSTCFNTYNSNNSSQDNSSFDNSSDNSNSY